MVEPWDDSRTLSVWHLKPDTDPDLKPTNLNLARDVKCLPVSQMALDIVTNVVTIVYSCFII